MGAVKKLFRQFVRGDAGSTAVEFGLIAAPFLVLLFGALQLFLLFLTQQMLETAAESSGRLILTGNAQSLTQTQFQQTMCKSLPAILNCNNVMIDIQVASNFAAANTTAPTLTFDPTGKVSNNWQFTTGAPGSVVVMRVMYLWPMFNLLNFSLANVGKTSRLLMATAVFRNEVYK